MMKNQTDFYFLLAAMFVLYLAAKGKFSRLVHVLRGSSTNGQSGSLEIPDKYKYFFGQRTGKETKISGDFLPTG